MLLIALLAYSHRLKRQEKETTLHSTRITALEAASQGQSGLWTDHVITSKRIPRDKVVTLERISNGAFGVVYAGVYNGREVAIKMLLPASREKLHRVNEFLAEAKMTATMDHPHIVSFVGVAWDSLSDLCVVLEFMGGGELRTLLNKFEEDNHHVGLDRQKLSIALQVCHALSYLHSMMPSVIHRDLKSRNILLDSEMNAKLSDFGISRERLGRTMTAGVGTSLWMAPEVMLGERYDDKVDMFSFGVVLSELDMHSRPYTRVKKENLDSNGRAMTESVLLQKVALGQVQVEFSKAMALAAAVTSANKMFAIQATYLGDQCGGTPYAITVYEDENCTATACDSYDLDYGSRAINANMMTNDCSSNYSELLLIMRDKFGNSPYLLQKLHIDENCTEFAMAFGYPAMGACVGAYNESDGLYAVASLNTNGSASLKLYLERTCFANQQYMATFVSQEELATHSCTIDWSRWYSSNDAKATAASEQGNTRSTLSSGALAGIGLGGFGFAVVLVVAVIARRRQARSRALDRQDHFESSMTPTTVDSLEQVLRGQTGLWNDDVITAKRIPRDKVQTEKLISRGSYGEVYAGTYNERKVAVKMLLPAMRGRIQHVKDFLAEAKMTATMDHPHVVAFIGVAWDSLSDICVVLEYMDGGELRALLDRYEKDKHPIGFTREKTTIALEVCHALTYLHSLSPSIIHRDLKSRNILLSSDMKAKLSDFGISRERLDKTMTAGVGTSLWMAPEVMLGERYDDKADVFSFGVVLSELDVHSLPYAKAKKENLDAKGNPIPDSILLQRVALGIVKVEFSDACPEAIVELGRVCTSVYPTERPTAAEALYKLQLILSLKNLLGLNRLQK
ncbi:hypothetical protein PInf_014155 [Phytophthora infestans]|nr:hypothetical protein PInf_014155 [Phytophthora infestans]